MPDFLTSENIILLTIAIMSFIGNVIQFIVNRINHKKDTLINRKYEVYSDFMKKIDDIMNNIRKDPNMIINIYLDFTNKIFSSNSDETNELLINFNEELIENIKNATEPLMIIKQELNSLLLICSIKLRKKINELAELITDFNNELQKCLSYMSPNDSNLMTRKLQTLGQNERWLRF